MAGRTGRDRCIFCKCECVIERKEEIGFRQWTDKGYVSCLVVIPVRICAQCGGKTWDAHADAELDAAIRQEYDKLS